MKLWILEPVNELPDDDNPWKPWHERVFGFVIQADDENEARNIAHSEAGRENDGENSAVRYPWLVPKYSECVELVPGVDAGVVIRDFRAA